jgi:hypothetical protein
MKYRFASDQAQTIIPNTSARYVTYNDHELDGVFTYTELAEMNRSNKLILKPYVSGGYSAVHLLLKSKWPKQV